MKVGYLPDGTAMNKATIRRFDHSTMVGGFIRDILQDGCGLVPSSL